jgi:type II secretory pathway component PulL
MFKKPKNVRILIIALILIVTSYQTYQATKISKDVVQVIKEQEELPLNSFMDKYKNKEFSKVDLVNDTKLLGYIFV